jgi:site-specific DNA-methyltransferase (adenine-specific)
VITTGDCIEVMAAMDADSVDAIVTDPPYGLEFMGKEWDRFAGKLSDRNFKGFTLSQQRTRNVKCPDCEKWAYDHPGRLCECGGIYRAQHNAFQVWCEAWGREALRVAKPGGYLLAFGGTRTHHRLVCGLEDAG